MTEMLIYCDSCASVSVNDKEFDVRDGVVVTFKNSKMLCRNCRSAINIPDGEYKAVRGVFQRRRDDTDTPTTETIRLLRDLPKEALVELAEAVKSAASEDEFVQRAEGIAPDVAAFLRSGSPTGQSWEFWAPILLSILLFLIGPPYASLFEDDAPTPPVINNIQIQELGEPPSLRQNQPRNEKCACGSGLKYKMCHGSPSGPPDGIVP